MKRIGIFGGTFAPIHNGHISAALCFFDKMKLDELLIMPSRIPPHKQLGKDDDPEHRYNMARAAFENRAGIIVSDWEISRDCVSYTRDTLLHFGKYGKLFFLCGTDMFLTLGEWRDPATIFSLATIVPACRYNDAEEATVRAYEHYRAEFGADIVFLNNKTTELSSTEVRETVKKGGDISGMVPAAVEKYIRENRLYI